MYCIYIILSSIFVYLLVNFVELGKESNSILG